MGIAPPSRDLDNLAELARHEAEARIWAEVYAFRAELCAIHRQPHAQADDSELDEILAWNYWSFARMLAAINRYMERQPDLHGDAAQSQQRRADCRVASAVYHG